ncbi:hypothetical protein PR048_028269 [Dryococelus australis]|uniref:Uncharacterized protein n=1 Tax=Dryococelus australis TaxID=614101 RepID=A0ABQ9GIV3_9NEOP|nr:hypothetical protein PR048_028269 [Dryococelus australis]
MSCDLLDEEYPYLFVDTHYSVQNELDQEICNTLLLNEEQGCEDYLIKEMEIVDKHNLKYYELRAQVNNINREASIVTDKTVRKQNKNALRLPKLELTQYDGKLSGWISFWSQFQRIDKDNTLCDEKFQYLIQTTSIGSRAHSIVECFSPAGNNYKKALQVLQKRFGRKELLIEYYTRELLKLVVNNQAMKLSTLYDRLETTQEHWNYNYSAILYPLIESCLPVEFLKTWQRSSGSQAKTLKEHMESLMVFLKDERVTLTHSKPVRDKFKFAKRDMKSKEGPNLHVLLLMCFACTKPKYSAQQCRGKCIICEGRYSIPLLCHKLYEKLSPEMKLKQRLKMETINESLIPTTVNNLTSHCISQVFLQTFVEFIMQKALIDSGFQRSYIVEEIGYKPLREKNIVHSLYRGRLAGLTKHKCFQVQLVNLSSDYACSFEALDQ